MRITKQRTLTGLILAVLMALPLCSILSRVIYVQSNKNAYQSYSDSGSTELVNTTTLQSNIEYYFNNVNDDIYDEDLDISLTTIIDFNSVYDGEEYQDYNDEDFMVVYSESQGMLISWHTDVIYNGFIYYDFEGNFKFKTNTTVNVLSNFFYEVKITNGYLDNAFDYSISKFVEDNNFGRVDLTSWFMDMFLTDNVHNNLYVHFVNWYLNYVMLITLMHFLFAVLMWFINYCRRLLDRGMNYDW